MLFPKNWCCFGGSGKSGSSTQMKKELGMLDGAAIVVGVIIGAGIFVSPKGVLIGAGSPGMALIVWVLSGLVSLIGALCYAELGTMIPRSGGDYIYILSSLGPLPAFVFLWVALLIIMPTSNAVLGLTFSYYVLQPFWPGVEPPDIYIRLLSAAVIILLTAVNCYNVKLTAKLQDGFAVMKLLAVAVIIIAGMVYLCLGGENNLATPFEETSADLGKIALAFYSGLYTFAGWNYLNFVTEELKDPFKNLPRAIWLSMPLVTVIYGLTNAAYFAVLTKAEILASNSVAETFGDHILGVMAWIMPFFVACSTFGGLNSSIFAPSRMVLTGAREGQLPKFLAIINPSTFTPIPALVFLCIMSLIMLIIKDVYTLINYMAFVEALGWAASVAGLLWLRWKKPDAERPIKVNILLPIIFLLISICLVVFTLALSPVAELGFAVAIIFSGIPVYFLFIYWENKPEWMKRLGAIGASHVEFLDDDDETQIGEKRPLIDTASSA